MMMQRPGSEDYIDQLIVAVLAFENLPTFTTVEASTVLSVPDSRRVFELQTLQAACRCGPLAATTCTGRLLPRYRNKSGPRVASSCQFATDVPAHEPLLSYSAYR